MSDVALLLLGFALGLLLAAGLTLCAWAVTEYRRRAQGEVPPTLSDEMLARVARDHARVQDALVRERDRLGAVLQGMSEGVLAFDRTGRVTQVNPAAMEVLGRPDIPIGTPLVAFADIPRLRSTTVMALRGGAGSRELVIPGPPSRQVFVRATPVAATGGCVVVMLDVTDLRRMERAQRDFVSNVSHELRTPVAVVLANTETLVDGAAEDPEHRAIFLDGVLRQARRLASMIDDLLDLARIDGGKYPLELESVRVDEAIALAVHEVAERAVANGQRLEVDVEPEACAVADDRALGHVLTNLLDNAVKYAGPGARIVVRARQESGQVQIEVIDDGPGIADEHHERIFERFYRVDPGRSRDVGGTGLGLALVKQLVEAMGGEIAVRGNAPRGAIFTFSLRVGEAA